MKKIRINDVIKHKIQENKKLFSKSEYEFVNKNFEIAKKIYLAGIIDAMKN